MTSTRPHEVGQRYLLQRQIGQGGMGAVWLAVDEVLGREVAIKRIGLFPGGGSPGLVRAQREAKLAARLNHPHVVAVFDFVTENDEQWLVMEYVAGTDLSALLGDYGGLPPADASALLAQVADALSSAHAAGIVHRDVKPSNILVTPDGNAKLADFGIARARDSTITASGLVTGSPAYLAPEVASGSPATEASDVWSLGATLYHALSGRPPYDTTDSLAAMYRIVHEEPPRLPGDGWPAKLLETTMATDPASRWSMTQVRGYLMSGPPRAQQLAASPEVSAPLLLAGPVEPDPEPPAGSSPDEADKRRVWTPQILAVAALLLFALVAGWALLRQEPSPPAADGARDAPSTEPSTGPSVSASRSPSQSPSRRPSQSATALPQQSSPAVESPTPATPAGSPTAASPTAASPTAASPTAASPTGHSCAAERRGEPGRSDADLRAAVRRDRTGRPRNLLGTADATVPAGLLRRQREQLRRLLEHHRGCHRPRRHC